MRTIVTLKDLFKLVHLTDLLSALERNSWVPDRLKEAMRTDGKKYLDILLSVQPDEFTESYIFGVKLKAEDGAECRIYLFEPNEKSEPGLSPNEALDILISECTMSGLWTPDAPDILCSVPVQDCCFASWAYLMQCRIFWDNAEWCSIPDFLTAVIVSADKYIMHAGMEDEFEALNSIYEDFIDILESEEPFFAET